MDSKLRRLTITGIVLVVLIISVLVVYSNKDVILETFFGNAVYEESSSDEGKVANEVQVNNGQIGDDLQGFMRDPSFFDEDENEIFKAVNKKANTLSLLITSVEKDLRIQVLNAAGELVKNESFFVDIDGLGEIKDLDKDGIIYVGDLKAGEYCVSLKPIAGFIVPETPTRVYVKDKVEYLAISDIKVLIKTEEEIDAEAEDTRIVNALSDADKTENRRLLTGKGNVYIGIDVSKWQGEIDWDKVKNAGVDFAIIRAGYRGSMTGTLVEDPYFRTNIEQAKRAGIKVGTYFFTQAVNEVEAVEEASAVIELCKDYQLDFPAFIDTEGAGGNGRADSIDKNTRTIVCDAFCRTIENAGLKAGVYASRNWYNNNLSYEALDDYCIWLAEYRSVPLFKEYYNMWQHSSKGSVDGIKGNVDLDIYYPQ